MAETQEHLQQGEEEVKIGQVTKFLQCLDAVLTENRNIFTVLPELHKHFVELEANMTKRDNTVGAGNNNGYASKWYAILYFNRFMDSVQNVRYYYFFFDMFLWSVNNLKHS